MGENGTDDLQERENALARELASEDGGFGRSINQLTDIDFQDDSAPYTGGDGSNSYNDQFGHHDEDDEGENNADGDSGSVGGRDDIDYADDYADEESDDYDGDEDEEDEGDEGDEDTDADLSDNKLFGGDGYRNRLRKAYNNSKSMQLATRRMSKSADRAAKKWKDEDYNGYIIWKPGDPITTTFLSKTWNEIHTLAPLYPVIKAANTAVIEGLYVACGPHLMLRLNHWIDKLSDTNVDTIGSLLQLTTKNGRRLVNVVGSFLEAFFLTQEYRQAALIAVLPTALNSVMAEEPVKSILNRLLTDAVPLINRLHRARVLVNSATDFLDTVTGKQEE